MKNTYLLLAILGALLPVLFFVGVFHGEAPSIGSFVPSLFVNGAAGGFAADLLISSLVFWIYMFNNSDGPRPWVFILLNLCIGLSCAWPAYLYRRAVMQAAQR